MESSYSIGIKKLSLKHLKPRSLAENTHEMSSFSMFKPIVDNSPWWTSFDLTDGNFETVITSQTFNPHGNTSLNFNTFKVLPITMERDQDVILMKIDAEGDLSEIDLTVSGSQI